MNAGCCDLCGEGGGRQTLQNSESRFQVGREKALEGRASGKGPKLRALAAGRERVAPREGLSRRDLCRLGWRGAERGSIRGVADLWDSRGQGAGGGEERVCALGKYFAGTRRSKRTSFKIQ